ncbi:MAG: hydantoinase/oxoprolinase family protein, partial [Proteobacteria bacterium]|nr:hydantoinase/oxoprolinase family protein [Pseudomonadota bacterium]
MTTGKLRLAVDIGGTFVDAMELDTQTGRFRFQKASATPRKPSDGVLNAIAALKTPLEDVELFTHGTTFGLNAVLERRGATVGIITNEGFRDIFLVGRANVPDAHMYDFRYARPAPLVPRRRIAGVRGRLDYKGRVVAELDEDGVLKAARQLIEDHGVEAIAICFLFSYLEPKHEQRAREIVLEEYPEVFVSTSARVAPQFREFERFTTAAMNAFIGPKVRTYVERLGSRLGEAGLAAELHIMGSNGGVATAQTVAELPVVTLLSGPAAGVL